MWTPIANWVLAGPLIGLPGYLNAQLNRLQLRHSYPNRLQMEPFNLTLAITGASGELGRRVTESLLGRHGVAPADLILVTRSPDKLADLASAGAEVRHGDFDDPASLESAFAGADRVLVISTDRVGTRVPGHKAAIDAAVAAGARSVAYTSGINPSDSNPIGVMWEHRQTEDHLRATAPGWTVLRNSIYAEILLGGADAALATGTHVTNEGDGRVSYVSRDDCAAAAAAVLATDGHDGKVYDITGAESLGAADVAALYSELGGRPVEVVQVDDDAYAAILVEHAGMPEPVAKVYASFGTGSRHGYGAPVSDTVQQLTGRPPRAAHDVLAETIAVRS
jgi:NAD(P)H dehydrogenase (quinone)